MMKAGINVDQQNSSKVVKRVYFLIAMIIWIDQMSKWLVVRQMEVGESVVLLKKVFYFTSSRNTGAALGFLSGKTWIFSLVTMIATLLIITAIHVLSDKYPKLLFALGMMLGGMIGNFLDRTFRHEVVDFIHVRFFPICNLADIALIIGTIMFLSIFIKIQRTLDE